MSKEKAANVLDDLFAQVADMQLRVRETLGEDEAAPCPELPTLRAPTSKLALILESAAGAAHDLRDADGVLVQMFGDRGARATRGLSAGEAESYAVGPPPVGPRVRALAIAYDGTVPSGEGEAIQMALAVPVLSGEETIGFLSIFTRSPEVVFDEDHGWALQQIAVAVQRAVEAPSATEAPVEEPRTATPLLRTALLVAAAAACVAAPLLMLAGIHSGLRVAAALALLTLAPGAAALPLFGSRSAPLELGLVVGTSLAVSAIVAEATLWSGFWSPTRSTVVLAGVSLVAILGQLGVRVVRREPVGAV